MESSAKPRNPSSPVLGRRRPRLPIATIGEKHRQRHQLGRAIVAARDWIADAGEFHTRLSAEIAEMESDDER